MENEFKDIVERMVHIRPLLGMTQKEPADKVGYSLSTVKKIECVSQKHSTGYFKAFFLQLGVSADHLISGKIQAFIGF